MLQRCPLREDVKRANVASPRLPIIYYEYNKHHCPMLKGSGKNYTEISESADHIAG